MILSTGKLVKSFGFAFKGIRIVGRSQQNFWIHVIIAGLVVVSGFYAKLTHTEWCILVLTMVVVLAMEVINTAIEKLVDFVSPGFNEQAGMIKDISAAAVLVTAIGAIIIGLIIFLPKIV